MCDHYDRFTRMVCLAEKLGDLLCLNVTYAVLKFQRKMATTAVTVENLLVIHVAMAISVNTLKDEAFFLGIMD